MDLNYPMGLQRLSLVLAIMSTAGCVAPETPVPTVWQRLGVPQAGARLRDGIVNRRGNFPGLEKKPPVLALADPANLEADMPDMIKAAAEIKQDQDLKKQKIKAIKFLATVNCGCYNKDDKVETAMLAALEDCDPDVRSAAIEGLSDAAGGAGRCRTGCAVTCCTKDILDKIEDIATGIEDGCYKEPNAEIRRAARELMRSCPPPPVEPIEPEELIAPDPQPRDGDGRLREESIEAVPEGQTRSNGVDVSGNASFRLSDYHYGDVESAPLVIEAAHVEMARRLQNTIDGATKRSESRVNSLSIGSSDEDNTSVNAAEGEEKLREIVNPELLVESRVVNYRQNLGEVLVHLPMTYQLDAGWTAILVDQENGYSLAEITETGGRRILLAIEDPDSIVVQNGGEIRLGLISR